MESAEALPENPSPADLRRLADEMLATRQDSTDEMPPEAKAALDAALPDLDEQYRRAISQR